MRDGRSLAYVESLGLRARRVADSVLAAKFDNAPADLTGDVVSDGHSQRKDAVTALDGFRAATGAVWLPFDDKRAQDTWRTVPARLKGADVLVTGRHHGIYMALKAGIPFVALGSNTSRSRACSKTWDGPICWPRRSTIIRRSGRASWRGVAISPIWPIA